MGRGVAPWQVGSFVLTLAGVGVAGYLAGVHLAGVPLVCGEGGGCHAVQASEYAELGGVPVALFGLGMYLAVAILGLLRWRRPASLPAATIAGFGLALAGVLFAAWLTYLELAVIGAICRWCVASAAITLGLLATEGVGVARLLAAPAAESGAGNQVGMPAAPRGAAGSSRGVGSAVRHRDWGFLGGKDAHSDHDAAGDARPAGAATGGAARPGGQRQ